MKKQIIRLTESDLHKIIMESVNEILKENTINWMDENIFDGKPHTYTVDVTTKTDGTFGYPFKNITTEEELDAAVRTKFPDTLNWKHPRRKDDF